MKLQLMQLSENKNKANGYMRKEVFRTKSMVNRCICFKHLIRSASIRVQTLKFDNNNFFLISGFNFFYHLIGLSSRIHHNSHRKLKVIMFAQVSANLQGCKIRQIIINKTLMAKFNLKFKRIDVGKTKCKLPGVEVLHLCIISLH